MGVLAKHKEAQADTCGEGQRGQRVPGRFGQALGAMAFDAVSTSFMPFASGVNQTRADF